MVNYLVIILRYNAINQHSVISVVVNKTANYL